MKKSLLASFALITLLLCAGSGPAVADILWYNGDLNSAPSKMNLGNTVELLSAVYDDFIVPNGGWTITTVWSNNAMNFTAYWASWEIRSGVSAGNGGVLMAHGIGQATQTATGRVSFEFPPLLEYTIQVTGLKVFLEPGTYWLNVRPFAVGVDPLSYISCTTGNNAVGQPPGNDGNSFFCLRNEIYFEPIGNVWSPRDYSMGVAGSPGGPGNPLAAIMLLLDS